MLGSLLFIEKHYSRLLLIILLGLMSNQSLSQNVDFGKSYINLSKGINGGTVETGDTLEIRASLVVRSGTYDSCRFRDVIPAGTSFIPGTIRVLTNEGKIYKQCTDAYGDDAGWISGTTITIHLGFNTAAAPATAFRRGRVANTHKPSFFSNTCIMIASFRVTVTASIGTTVSTGGGTITYKSGSSAIQTYTFPNNTLLVYTNIGICANAIGGNAIGTESNGTFGSGRPRNRGNSANVPVGYTYSGFTGSNTPNDYYYGVANNTSTQFGYSTVNTWPKPDPDPDGAGPLTTHRTFSLWDIIGDHTGAASPTAGNPAADTVANGNAGYMLVINAAYRIDSAFQQVITGLCPNTYYEISCWMRNICSKCGCDSNGKGATNSAGPPYYIPTAAGDSSGVSPNLTFDIDGIDYYTTGNLQYTGQWVRKGFTYLTGPSQNSLTLKFFNNAPGGGGNDWALDDITVRTCSPTMEYAPNITPNVCDSNSLELTDTVRSFFANYNYYKWQRSTDGGGSWTDVTGVIGPITPYWNGTEWEYVAQYTIPNTATYGVNDGDMYRVLVATLSANLADDNCRFADEDVITLNVLTCNPILSTKVISFTGSINDGHVKLGWTTLAENEELSFEIEKSNDGFTFSNIALIYSNGESENQTHYSFTDPIPIVEKIYYRLVVKNKRGTIIYSKTITVTSNSKMFTLLYAVNPFTNKIDLELSSPSASNATTQITDQAGKVIKINFFTITKGINNLSITGTENIMPGVYYIGITINGYTQRQRIIKIGN